MTVDTAAIGAAQPCAETTSGSKEPTALQTLTGIILHPVATFHKLRDSRRGYGWLAFGLTLVMLVLSSFASANATMQRFGALPSGGPSFQAGGTVSPPTTGNTATIQGPSLLSEAAIPLVGGALLLGADYLLRSMVAFVMTLVLGGRITFRQAMRMGIWSTIPSAARFLVQGIAMFATGQQSAPGLSAALTNAEIRSMPILSDILSHIDVYLVWSILLFGIGMVATARISKGKGVAAALAYVGIALAGTLILFAAGSALSSLLGSLGEQLGIPGLGRLGGGGNQIRRGGPGGGGGGGGGPGGGGGGPPPGG